MNEWSLKASAGTGSPARIEWECYRDIWGRNKYFEMELFIVTQYKWKEKKSTCDNQTVNQPPKTRMRMFLLETQRSAREKVWDTSRRWASLDQMKSLAHQTLLEKIRLAQKEPVDNFSAGWLA